MHPTSQRPGKPDKLSQGVHKQTSYPRVQWGNTQDKRETTDPRGKKNMQVSSEVRETEGNVWSRNNQDYRTTHAAGS